MVPHATAPRPATAYVLYTAMKKGLSIALPEICIF